MNDKLQNDIDRYVRNEMTAGEKADFEKEMLADSRLKQEVELTSAIGRNLGAAARKKALMKQWDAQRKAPSKSASRWWLRTAVSLAACFVLGFIIYDSYRMDAPDESPVVASMADNGVQTGIEGWQMRGGMASDEIVQLVEKGSYDEALAAIETAEADTALDAGMSADEREYMEQVRADETYRLTWLKILTLNALGRTDEAKALLTEFVKQEGEFREKARQLLNRIVFENNE